MAFVETVRRNGRPDEDDPVLEVLDFVVGYCGRDMALFP